MEAQQLPLLSPPEEVSGDKHEEVIVSKNILLGIGGVMACDGGKGMVGLCRWTRRKRCVSSSRSNSSHSYLLLPPRTCGHTQYQENMRGWRAIASEKAWAVVGPLAYSGVWGTRRLVGALPVRGEHVYAKRGDLTTLCRDREARNNFKYYSNNSSTKTSLLVER